MQNCECWGGVNNTNAMVTCLNLSWQGTLKGGPVCECTGVYIVKLQCEGVYTGVKFFNLLLKFIH